VAKKEAITRINDDISVVFYPPENPQLGFRGSWWLNVEGVEVPLTRETATALAGVLRNVATDLTPWQDMKP
jgi:hypothetical protein